MGLMQRFKREIRSVNGKQLAFELRSGYGAALGGLFERVARGKVHDSDIREVYGLADDSDEPKQVRISAGPQLSPSAKTGKYTALVSLHGVALYDLEYQPYCFSTLLLSQVMEQLGNDPSVDTIVLDINTPGGHVTGTQEAADAVWNARKKKPVIGIVNPLCASAGYWIGSQCTKLIGVPSADIGSIGVFMCHYDCSAMLADAGIKPTFIYAGEHKTEGNSMEPLSEDARMFYQSEVDQTYKDFLAAVARGRGISADKVLEKFGKGRCYGAPMAKRVGMIDEVATIKLALKSVGLTMDMPEDGRRRRGEDQCPDQAAAPDAGAADESASTDAVAAGEKSPNEAQAEEGLEPIAEGGIEPIAFRQDVDGDQTKIYVLAGWPSKVAISAELVAAGSGPVRVAGDTVTIAVENGAAVYNKVDEDAQGSWICALAQGSSFAEPPEPPRQQPAHEASAAARRRRIAILSA